MRLPEGVPWAGIFFFSLCIFGFLIHPFNIRLPQRDRSLVSPECLCSSQPKNWTCETLPGAPWRPLSEVRTWATAGPASSDRVLQAALMVQPRTLRGFAHSAAAASFVRFQVLHSPKHIPPYEKPPCLLADEWLQSPREHGRPEFSIILTVFNKEGGSGLVLIEVVCRPAKACGQGFCCKGVNGAAASFQLTKQLVNLSPSSAHGVSQRLDNRFGCDLQALTRKPLTL